MLVRNLVLVCEVVLVVMSVLLSFFWDLMICWIVGLSMVKLRRVVVMRSRMRKIEFDVVMWVM